MMTDNIRSHLFFSDPFSPDPAVHLKRKQMYSDLLVMIIENSRFLYPPSFYNDDIMVVKHDLETLDYCIDLFPSVNASVDVCHNRIILNIFSLLAANGIAMVDGLIDFLEHTHDASYEDLAQTAREWMESFDYMNMITQYIEFFSSQKLPLIEQEGQKTYLAWPSRVLKSNKSSFYSSLILQMMLLHELGHWQYARFNRKKAHEYFTFVYSEMLNYYSEAFYQNHKELTASWAEELIADYCALMVFTNMLRQKNINKQCTGECYITVGMFYGLIALEELGSGMYQILSTTHPPAAMRQSIVMRLYEHFFRTDLHIQSNIFWDKEIMEWRVIRDYFNLIIDDYWRHKDG